MLIQCIFNSTLEFIHVCFELFPVGGQCSPQFLKPLDELYFLDKELPIGTLVFKHVEGIGIIVNPVGVMSVLAIQVGSLTQSADSHNLGSLS